MCSREQSILTGVRIGGDRFGAPCGSRSRAATAPAGRAVASAAWPGSLEAGPPSSRDPAPLWEGARGKGQGVPAQEGF